MKKYFIAYKYGFFYRSGTSLHNAGIFEMEEPTMHTATQLIKAELSQTYKKRIADVTIETLNIEITKMNPL